jgi:hypothetical protein
VIITWQDSSKKLDLPISFTAWLGKATLRPLVNIDLRRFFLTMVGVSIEEISKKKKVLI